MPSPCPPAQEGFLVILQKEKEAQEAGAMHWTPRGVGQDELFL